MNYLKTSLCALLTATVLPLAAQTRIPVTKGSKINAVAPTERPATTPYTPADSARYQKLIIGAYHALSCDSFAVAKNRFEQALKLIPRAQSNVEVLFQLGQLEEREGRQRSAIEYYSRAIKKNHQYTKALLRRGGLFMLTGERQYALNDFTEVLQSEYNADALFFRGCVYADEGNYTAAKKDFDRILRKDPLDKRTLYTMALVEMGEGKNAQAIQRLDKLLNRFPQNSTYYAARADAWEGRAQEHKLNVKVDSTEIFMQSADKDWHRALDLNPKEVNFVKRYAMFLNNWGKKDEALKQLNEAEGKGIPYTELEQLRTYIRKGHVAKK